MMDFYRETHWFAVHTKPHREDAAAFNIARLDLEVFLPKVKQERVICGIPREVIKPLFPGYLFARFCPATYLHLIRYARGVLRVVSCGDVPLPVDEAIIGEIRSRIGPDGYVRLEDRSLRPGDRVLVREGPLRGLKGIFERELDDRERVILLLEAIEYQARVVIERRCLSLAEGSV
jgi:transcriptional antiterminator RfaH